MKTFGRSLMTIAAMVAVGTISHVQAQDNAVPATATPPPAAPQPSEPPPAAPPAYVPAADQEPMMDGPYYHAQEVSLDMFASGTIHQDYLDNGDFHHHVRAGGGVGLNYFFSRYVGVGADTYTEDRDPCFLYAECGNVILRLPIDHTGIAPYIFGGGGHQWDFVSQNFGQAGAGVEFRLCRHLGFFVDGRWVIADRTENYGEGRAGLRFSF